MPPNKEWTTALNEIAVTFNESSPVMGALGRFEERIQAQGGHDNEDLLHLIEAMMAELGIGYAGLDREFLLRPFRPNPNSSQS